MSRQQARASGRSASKASRRTIRDNKAENAGLATQAPGNDVELRGGEPLVISFNDLNERQRKGFELWRAAQQCNTKAICLTESATMWGSAKSNNTYYEVAVEERNHRGTIVIKYRCNCWDFKKHGATDCKHIFAEKLQRGAVIVDGPYPRTRPSAKKAERRPARKRKNAKGKSIRSSQRDARVKMGPRLPELCVSVAAGYRMHSSEIVVPERKQLWRGGKTVTAHPTRALTLIYKIAEGKSADHMIHIYRQLINDGKLFLHDPPHQNTLTEWMNDERLTPVLREFLRLTSLPFRRREVGAIIDSSKVSQLRNAHAKNCEYDGDERPGADWMKCHAIVGVETLVVMDVIFTGSVNTGTHDINYLRPLVTSASEIFELQFVLADKAYLSSDVLKWLWESKFKAAIPLKKGWFEEKGRNYHAAIMELVEWYKADNNRQFHEVYRLRPKIEALFSVLKRMSQEYCWSRGRRSDASKNAEQPCTAWINETLCKFIFLNLRTTISLEEETGYRMDYTKPSKHLPPPDEPLLKTAA